MTIRKKPGPAAGIPPTDGKRKPPERYLEESRQTGGSRHNGNTMEKN